MAALCEVNGCGVLAVGRCPNCGRTFCATHRVLADDGKAPASYSCIDCQRSVAWDVFVGYQASSAEAARELTIRLRREGLEVFFAIDSVLPGADFTEAALRAIRQAHATVLVISESARGSVSFKREAHLAAASARTGRTLLIPVYLSSDAVADLPALDQFQSLRAVGSQGLQEAAEAIASAVGKAKRAQANDATQLNRSIDEAISRLRSIVEAWDQPEGGRELAETISDVARLAIRCWQAGLLPASHGLLEEALIAGELLPNDDPAALNSRTNLATTLQQLGQLNEAANLLRETLASSTRILGTDHPTTLSTRTNLATTLQQLGQLDEAANLLRETLASSTRILGTGHPTTLNAQASLAGVLQALGEHDAAVAGLRQAFDSSASSLGPDDPLTAAIAANLRTLTGGGTRG